MLFTCTHQLHTELFEKPRNNKESSDGCTLYFHRKPKVDGGGGGGRSKLSIIINSNIEDRCI